MHDGKSRSKRDVATRTAGARRGLAWTHGREGISIDLSVNEVRRANDEHALVVANARGVAARILPRFGLALILNDLHQLIGLLGFGRTIRIFAGVADDATAAATTTAATSATRTAAAAAESTATAAATTTAAATSATLTALIALLKRGAQIEVRRVVKVWWFKEQIAHGIHAQFARGGDGESILGAGFDEAFANLPRARRIGSAHLEHALDNRERSRAFHRQRNFHLRIDAIRAAFARVAHDQWHAELLLHIFKRGLRLRALEVHRDVAVEKCAEQLPATNVLPEIFRALFAHGLDAL